MDALLILLYYFDELCTKITFCTSNHKMPLRLIKEKLGHENCKALLRFHAVNRSDLTGRFYGYSKQDCWDVFVSLSTRDSSSTISVEHCKTRHGIIKKYLLWTYNVRSDWKMWQLWEDYAGTYFQSTKQNQSFTYI